MSDTLLVEPTTTAQTIGSCCQLCTQENLCRTNGTRCANFKNKAVLNDGSNQVASDHTCDSCACLSWCSERTSWTESVHCNRYIALLPVQSTTSREPFEWERKRDARPAGRAGEARTGIYGLAAKAQHTGIPDLAHHHDDYLYCSNPHLTQTNDPAQNVTVPPLYHLSCPKCGYLWWSYEAFPKQCPKCHRDLNWPPIATATMLDWITETRPNYVTKQELNEAFITHQEQHRVMGVVGQITNTPVLAALETRLRGWILTLIAKAVEKHVTEHHDLHGLGTEQTHSE